MVRAICVVRPRFVVVENVAALTGRGMGTVLGDLAYVGHDAEWDCLSACQFGFPHTRERVFIVADAAGQRLEFRRRLEQPTRSDTERYVRDRQNQPEPPRVADGLSHRMERNRALGGAVLPVIAEWIGRLIKEEK